MENNEYIIQYDETKELETIYDFHGSEIFRVNTNNATEFLKVGAEFDDTVVKKVDDQRRLRLIYVVDKFPPLSAIMKHIENPYHEVSWGVYAIILPKDVTILSKITPIIKYALTITELRDKYAIKLFDYTHRNNLKEVIEWQDQNMEIRPQGFIDDSGIQ